MLYLDNAATSFPKAPGVAEAVAESLNAPYGNAGRSSHRGSIRSSRLFYETRELASTYFSFYDSSRVIFKNGSTEAINDAIFGVVKKGYRILTTSMEHNAVSRPIRHLCGNSRVTVDHIPSDKFGNPDIELFGKALTQQRPDLVVFTGESNVTGTIMPIDVMMRVLEEHQVPYIIDGAQLTGDRKIILSDMHHGCFCCSGHKGLLSPAGIGLLIIGDRFPIRPTRFGGTGSRSDSDIQPEFFPDILESGTQNISGIAGLKASLTYLLSIEDIFTPKRDINNHLYRELSRTEGIRLHSPADNRGSVISFTHRDASLTEMTRYLDDQEIALRMGLHCAPWAHSHIGTFSGGGTLRVSTGLFTTIEEIDLFISILKGYDHG